MEKRAVLLALAVMLPLALYGIPYAYAATMSSSYSVDSSLTAVGAGATGIAIASCINPGDYATGGGYFFDIGLVVAASYPSGPHTGPNPTGWEAIAYNPTPNALGLLAYVVCQTPVTVAGIGVPEFGSLYIAIALGAVVYFMLSRHFKRSPTVSAQVQA
jgi:hypothetical protein